MTGVANGGPRLPRRSLLALAALAALPAAGCTRRSEYGGGTRPAADPFSVAPNASGGAPSSSAPNGTAAGKKGATGSGGAVGYVPGKVRLGSYLDLGGMTLPQALALRRKQLGREQDIVHVFYKWTDTLPSSRPDIGDQSILMISWEGTFYKDITGGSSDKLIAAAARQLAAHAKPTLLRWGWEMNGNWFDWDGTHNGKTTSGYAKSWQRMRKIFHEEGADNVSAYPFNKQTPTTLFHRICEEYGARKPIMLTETASIDNGGTTKRDWINAFAAYMKAQPAIGGVVWFDTDTQPGTSENFRIDSTSSVLAAYKAMADSSRFGVV
jgi:hypothetical protein